MRKKILLPTDFSKNAWNAIVYATMLYRDHECDFYLLNVFSTRGYSIDNMMVPEPGEANYEKAREASENGLGKAIEGLTFRDDNPKHHFHAISQFNSLLEAIKDLIAKKDIEIIVMGTKGATGAKEVLYGSNAVNLMEKVRECPVLAFPESASMGALVEIVFPTSYKTNYKRRELKHLVEIAKSFGSSIRVLHISEDDHLNDDQTNNRELLEEYFEGLDYSFHTLSNIQVQTAINCFVESRESDMIALINKKHSFFGNILSRPLIKGIGYHSKVPLLVMHNV